MCGRFTLKTPVMEWLANLFPNWSLGQDSTWSETLPSAVLEPRFNIAPSQPIVVVRQNAEGKHIVETMRWGLLPAWADSYSVGYSMINARSESLAEKPSFRPSIVDKRCVILADGYYEWRKLDAKTKQPFWIHQPNESVFAMAGLWAKNYKIPEIENRSVPILSTTIITTASNHDTRDVHDRMPAIFLDGETALNWLDSKWNDKNQIDNLLNQLVPSRDGTFALRAVSTSVNNVRNNGDDLIRSLNH